MNTKKQNQMLKPLCLLFLSLINSACVTVPDTKACSVLGELSDGASCDHTLTSRPSNLTLQEFIDFLQPQEERECVPVGHLDEKQKVPWVMDFNVCSHDQSIGIPMKLPKRAGAISQSAEEWNKLKTALEEACRELGKKCKYEIKEAIESIKTAEQLFQPRKE